MQLSHTELFTLWYCWRFTEFILVLSATNHINGAIFDAFLTRKSQKNMAVVYVPPPSPLGMLCNVYRHTVIQRASHCMKNLPLPSKAMYQQTDNVLQSNGSSSEIYILRIYELCYSIVIIQIRFADSGARVIHNVCVINFAMTKMNFVMNKRHHQSY